MDITPAPYTPVEGEDEEYDNYLFEERLERGEVGVYDTPIKLYFDKHPEIVFPWPVIDHVTDVLKIKTIGVFTEKYFDILEDIFRNHPELDNQETRNLMDEAYSQMHDDVLLDEFRTIRVGPDR